MSTYVITLIQALAIVGIVLSLVMICSKLYVFRTIATVENGAETDFRIEIIILCVSTFVATYLFLL